MKRILASVSGAVLLLAGALAWRGGLLFSQAQPTAAPDSIVSVRIRFGLSGQAAKSWAGSASVQGGKLVALRNWRPRPGDTVEGSSWKLATRPGPPFVYRPWETTPVRMAGPYLATPGVVADVQAPAAATLRVETVQGSFEVALRDLQPGQAKTFLNGEAAADIVPFAQLVSSADSQNDFAAALAGPGGEAWSAWVSYAKGASSVVARRFDGRAWSSEHKVTPAPGDIFLVKLGRDKSDRVWAVWSAQVDGNFDLYARRFDGRQWGAVERLTTEPQPDVYHNLATDSNGNLWLVWQGFREGKSDIFARRYDGERWSAAERVSGSAANDWEPAIAADGQGRVYVAWDTYDQGNYDVAMRSWSGGKWSDAVPVASTPKFEAHVSLACDAGNRLWAAWSESGFEWGKDTGFLVKQEGTPLYQWRAVGAAVWDGAAWQEPTADVNRAIGRPNDFPVLQADGGGRVWLIYRHRTLRIRDVPSFAPAHRAAWELYTTSLAGDRWTEPVAIPFSANRTDVRSGFAPAGPGAIYAAWPTDNRDFEDFLFKQSDVHFARVSLPAGAPPALRARRVEKLTAFGIHTGEKADLTAIRGYSISSGGKTYRIYRGDIHRHTEFSMDGNNDGTLQQTYRYAMDAAELDFMGVSEHNAAGGPDQEYINWLLQQMADVLMLPRTFATLYGYERSLNYPNGHRNVMFATRGIPTLAIPREEQQGKTGAKALYAYLKRYGGIAVSHTSASNMGTDWRDNDPEVEPLVEIYQGDRVSAEYEGAPKAANAGNPASAPGGFRPAGYVWNAWAKGYKLGVQASSDHLSTHISYACTIATDFSRKGLIDAMKQRHSYGATDNIILDYRATAAGREHLQGDILESGRDLKLSIKAIGTAPIRQIDIIRNNTFVHTVQPMRKEVSFTFVDGQPPRGESYYYVRVQQVDEQMAWSSPIWVKQ